MKLTIEEKEYIITNVQLKYWDYLKSNEANIINKLTETIKKCNAYNNIVNFLKSKFIDFDENKITIQWNYYSKFLYVDYSDEGSVRIDDEITSAYYFNYKCNIDASSFNKNVYNITNDDKYHFSNTYVKEFIKCRDIKLTRTLTRLNVIENIITTLYNEAVVQAEKLIESFIPECE